MRYELEKVIVKGDEWENYRTETTIAESDSIQELLDISKTVKLKGNKYRHEHLAIIELDEYGDIVDYVKIIYAKDRK